jgi:hypothetical protein
MMTTDPWFEKRFAVLAPLGWMALPGGVLLIAAMVLGHGGAQVLALVLAALLLVPLLCWLVILPIWHWKERYRGDHGDLWGALLVIETSGWFKIVYWFRHVIPDWRGRGRYE